MNPSSSHPPGPATPDATASGSRAYTPGLSDGLGDRLMMFDTSTQSSLELLRFKREFSDAPGFEEAVRARIDELSRFKHPSIAPVRAIQALDDGVALVSTNTPGRRLSEMVHVARGAPFAMDLIQQLAPALAALHQQGGRIAHGLLTAERIIITREGRLVVVEHVLATAFEQLRLSPTRLRTELGIAVPNSADPVGLNQRSDVVQLGFLALSLLLGRRLDPAHFPTNINTLLDEFTHADAASSAKLRPWLERALQVNERAFASAEEAHDAFSESEGKSREPRPAPPAVTVTKESQVLAFRPTKSDNANNSPVESKPDTGKLKLEKKDANEPMKIELQKLDPPPAPPPVISVASPRMKKGGAGKWIAIAVLLAGAAGGALYMSGMFGGSTSTSDSTPQSSTPARSTATAPTTSAVPPPPFRPEPTPSATPGPATPPTAAPPPESTPASRANGTSTSSGSASGSSGTTGSDRLAAGTTPAQTDSTPSTPADKPAPAAGGFGAVKVSAPIDLKVFENGNLVGSTSGAIAVLQGTHTFEMVNEALGFRVRSTVNVRGGQLTPLAINLPNGRLSINAVPWADVFIDGKSAGQTPLANVPIQIGQHEIVFRHPQLGEERQTVTVRADGLTKVSATFKQ